MTASPVSVAPAGDVTLMFTDIQGSTQGWQTHGERFHAALLRHNVLLRQAIAAQQGYEVKTVGDAFMVAFDSPLRAALCALDIQRLIEAEPFGDVGGLRVRIGLHAADMEPIDGDYFGNAVNRAARIESAAQGRHDPAVGRDGAARCRPPDAPGCPDRPGLSPPQRPQRPSETVSGWVTPISPRPIIPP